MKMNYMLRLAGLTTLILGIVMMASLPVFARVTITILNAKEPTPMAEAELQHEFEQEFGIKVERVMLPWSGQNERLKLEIATSSSSFDVYTFDGIMSQTYLRMGGLEPLEKYLQDPNFPDLNLDTFVPNIVKWYGTWGGEILAAPLYVAHRLYAYRRDLFENPTEKANFKAKYGYDLKPPETWDQYRDICEFFTRDTDGDGTVDFWGTTRGFGRAGLAWDEFSDVYYSFDPIKDGKWYFDKDWKPIFNNEKAVKALQFLKDLADAGYYPPGYLTKLWGGKVDPIVKTLFCHS